MPLTNPYKHPINSANASGWKLNSDVDPNDKSLIASLRPAKGTIQLVINNLLKNLCNDLRNLDIHAYRTDGDAILELLTRPRKIGPEGLEFIRERCTSVSVSEAVSSGIFQSGDRTGLREEATSIETESTNAKSGTGKRVKRDSKKVRAEETINE